MIVMIPTQLRSYTGAAQVQATGNTLAEIFDDLNHQFPGLRFRIIDEQDRIREHILIVVNKKLVKAIDQPIKPDDVIRIIGSLSGG
jgi:sulfur-carrier protein